MRKDRSGVPLLCIYFKATKFVIIASGKVRGNDVDAGVLRTILVILNPYRSFNKINSSFEAHKIGRK